MNITVFQSDKGDCLLVTSNDGGRRILVDGGMNRTFTKFVAPTLGSQPLDLVYVSHIDEDHISGVLKLLDNEVDWRVYDFKCKQLEQQANKKEKKPKEPASPRPPEVKNIWHNAFSEMPKDLNQKIGDVLVASAAVLSGSKDLSLQAISTAQRELATSVTQALKVSRRIKDHLGIPHNRQFGGKLAFLAEGRPAPCVEEFNPLRISVLGPFEEDLEKLKQDWKEWHEATQNNLEEFQRWTKRQAERLGTSDAFQLLALREAQAGEIGNRKKVTQPNLASLMLLVEEDGRTLLLTGDGHATDILKGLARHDGMLDARNRIHVNVLKVQHHGAEFNIDKEFVSRVTADHYIFCGNGEHQNPDLGVLEMLIASRLEDVPYKATHPKAGASSRFTLWFNTFVEPPKEQMQESSKEEQARKEDPKQHMREVLELVKSRAEASQGRMTYNFLSKEDVPFLNFSI